ncbi:phosphate transport system permease protein [Nocardioides alpinus]|uniref:Phosphate transport system permease protein PstA n=1 Tax=Nocardioides alpinus TaxID=748909 RepID=A0A1I0W859_9ACTN|nr:phosphate ABC transporter permease PstA [Nocardioides alpinus]PKH37725.1 phosphate ABC transporter, permease protein PstA [Nocardioides alpinus]SFA84213.1 phosphate transport system permease protein [Nocardioides alpinus]
MSTTLKPAPVSVASIPLTHGHLPRGAEILVGVVAAAAAGLFPLLLGWGLVAWVIVSVILFIVGLTVWSAIVETRRSATDRMVTALVWTAFGIALVPLVSLLWTVVSKGVPAINSTFLSYSAFRTSLDQPIGIYHAIVGTLVITLCAVVISVPIGIFAAIYLVEYGKGNRLARGITFLVDVMTGIPSIVAGLFAFSMFTAFFGAGYRAGIGGAVALSLLMIPIVVRSTEEMLRLVPDDLREAAYALGTPKWRTITKVVLRTSLGGIITGVTLATARIIGETAPLLLIAGLTTRTNVNPFEGFMTTLPVFIYSQFQKGTAADFELAWGTALVLVIIVLLLNIVARVIGKIFAPKTGR